MECHHQPAAISATIMTSVMPITQRVRDSAWPRPVAKSWRCCQGLRSWTCMGLASYW